MNSWRPYPLLRLVFPFVAGIVAELYWGSIAGQLQWLYGVMVVIVAVSQTLPRVTGNYRLRWITGIIFNGFLVLAGYEIACCHHPENDPGYFGRHPDGLFVATVSEPPSSSLTRIKTILEVRYCRENGTWKRSCGKAIGYLKSGSGSSSLQYGDHILLRAGFTAINDNSNPHSFNYARYLKNKGISHRVFAESYDWKTISIKRSGFIRRVAIQVRDNLLNILRVNHVEGKEFAVAAALLLGYVDELDAELRNDYAASGAMHILSVSGMHVGIIYIFLEFLLGFLNKNKPGRLLKAIVLLVFIWFYALVTGLSPCVLRSAAMLSLPILGKSLNRIPNMYNIIAASMVFILALDPFLILDIGFQLSYLAVIGIIVMYKPIYDLYVTSAWFPDKVWSILAVSIAAQIATLPITLYIFHQFPNYFMLTNIFVVPLSSFIIYIGIGMMAVGGIPAVAALCAKVLIFLVWLLNSVIHLIEQLPWSTIQGIFISTPEMVLLYLLIAFAFLYLTVRKISFLFIFIIVTIMLNLLFLDFKVHRLRSSRMVIFNAGREALYMFTTQDKAILLFNGPMRDGATVQKPGHDVAFADMKAHGINFNREFWLQAGGRPPEIAGSFVPAIVLRNFIQFNGYRIALLNKSLPRGFNRCIHVDLLIITGNPRINIADVIKIYHPRQIVIDATNSRFRTVQWIKDAATSGVECHSVAEHGAYQKEF